MDEFRRTAFEGGRRNFGEALRHGDHAAEGIDDRTSVSVPLPSEVTGGGLNRLTGGQDMAVDGLQMQLYIELSRACEEDLVAGASLATVRDRIEASALPVGLQDQLVTQLEILGGQEVITP